MIYTSTELFNAFAEDTRQIMVRVKINGAVFDNDNISTLNLEYGSMDGANFSLGSTFASSLKITFAELVEGLAELDEIEVEMGAVLPNGTVEYVPMGTFIINEEVMMDRNNNTTSIDAMDRMVMLGEIYEPTLEGDYARIIDIAVDIANQAGVVVSSDFDRLRTDGILIPREKTLREAIGIIAQFEVGFATFNRDGELAIRKLNDPNFNITPEDYTMKGLVKNEVPFRLNGVQCQIGDSEEDVLQTGASTGTQIVLNNPSMTQAHLDRIYTELSTLNYYPFTLDWYGHPALEAGDWIEIEDLQGNKFKTPNLHYTLDFNGGLKAKSQAETTSSSEVVYQYKSPLKQEIQAIAARLSASSGNHVYDDLTEPENPKEGDLWFKPEGPDTLILKYTRLEDGTLDWVEKLNTGDTTKNADAIAEQQQEIEDAREVADEAVDSINTAIQNAGFTSLDDTIQNISGIASGVKSELDIAIENAGFTSLDDTLQNMNYITMDAEQNAQQAITDASNAHSLAQTSISEAQTAQANSLAALGEAEDALEGVSSLNVRVDDVKAELELKADNAFMNEDGTLTTLSNAITFNAHRFSSDMSRIESRVESLVGAVNLVILRGAIEGTRLIGGEVFPNAHEAPNTIDNNTMAEMIDVEAGEQLALSKETTDNDNFWRISFYLNNNYVSRITTGDNQHILTIPSGVNRMWVSYPKGSKPQIVRGTEFLPYRPNIADQMTTDEMVIFRNEYDEYADRTERRLTAIDGENGSLDVLSNEIITTANSIRTDMTAYIETKVSANEFAEFYQNEYLETAQEVSRKISLTDVKIGGRNLLVKSAVGYAEGYSVGASIPGNPPSYTMREYDAISNHIDVTNEGVEDYYTFSKQDSLITDDEWFRIYWISKNGGVIRRDTSNENVFTTKKPENAVTLRFSFPKDSMAKVEKGNIATGYSEAFEDTDAKITHIETEWTQTFDTFSQTVSGIDGRVTEQKQTLDGLEATIQATQSDLSGTTTLLNQTKQTVDSRTSVLAQLRTDVDGKTTISQFNTLNSTVNGTIQRIGNAEGKITQIETNVNGLQTTVANKANQSQVTQLATGLNALVESTPKNLLTNGDFSNENVMHGWSTDTNVTFNRMLENVAEFYSSSGLYLNRVWNDLTLETGKKYKITIDARANVSGRTISLGQFNGLYNETIVLSSTLRTYEVIYEASNDSRIGIFFNVAGTYGISNVKVVETTAISKGQISVLSDSITQSISSLDGRVNTQIQTLENSLSAINDPETGRLSIVEQTAAGIQSAVYNADGSSKITQLANGLSSVVESLPTSLIPDSNNLTSGRWGGWLTDLSISFNRSINEKSELFVGNQGTRIWFPSMRVEVGKKYKVTFDIRTNESGRKVSVGGWEPAEHRIGLSSTSQSYEAVFEPKSTGDFSIYFFDTGTYEIGNVRVFETTLISETQISQLADNINLRVEKGDLLSQINIEADRMLFQSEKILLDADNVIFTGKAWIPSSVIGDLEADKITSGTLDAGQITVVNLDVSSLSGETAEFVQAGFNSISGTTSIDGDGISILRTDGTRSARLGVDGYEFWLDGAAHGTIGIREYAGTDPLYLNRNSISLYAQKDSYLSLSYQGDGADDGSGYVALSILGDTGDVSIYKSLDVFGKMNMNGSSTLNQNVLSFGRDDQVMGRIYPVAANKELQIRGADLLRFVVGEDTKMTIRTGGVRMSSHINMNSYDLTNVGKIDYSSDERLKDNIIDRTENDLATIMAIDYKNYYMNGKKQRGFIAQQLQSIDSDLITVSENGYLSYDGQGYVHTIGRAMQQLVLRESNTNQVASQALRLGESNESKIHKLQQELSKANRRIEELERVM